MVVRVFAVESAAPGRIGLRIFEDETAASQCYCEWGTAWGFDKVGMWELTSRQGTGRRGLED